MKCPVCRNKISDLDEICPVCKINLEEYGKTNKKTENAKYLNIFAIINLIMTVIWSIIIWVNFSIDVITKDYSFREGTYSAIQFNWYGIFGGLATLIVGLTMYFLLKTVVDIYYK